MSLYKKYRPKSFNEMFGNEEEIQSLQNLIDKKEIHTFLFTGEAGCGKTTAARICADLLEGTVREINSSNNRGIDTARDIIDNIRYVSIDGKSIIYIIDEVHKATNEWQNAMLKPLEETPEHVYFFLCTTNPEKLIKPLKSRCTHIHFKNFKTELVIKLLRLINRKEKAGVDLETIEDIADNCKGSPRNALVLFEQIIGIENPEKIIKEEIEDKNVKQLCQELLKQRSWSDVCGILKNLNNDVEQIRMAVLTYMSKVLLSGKKDDNAGLVLEYFSEPFYSSGKAGLILACYQSFFVKN